MHGIKFHPCDIDRHRLYVVINMGQKNCGILKILLMREGGAKKAKFLAIQCFMMWPAILLIAALVMQQNNCLVSIENHYYNIWQPNCTGTDSIITYGTGSHSIKWKANSPIS